jgi:hypothetical protein
MSRQWKLLEDVDYYKRWKVGEVVTGDDGELTHVFVTMTYCDEYDSEWAKEGRYSIAVESVSPWMVQPEEIERARSSCGWEEMGDDIETVCIMLLEYGIKATLFSSQGNNQQKLQKECRDALKGIMCLFGFYADRSQNAIGSTGWDFMSGNILGGLSRRAANPKQETANGILRTMQGD